MTISFCLVVCHLRRGADSSGCGTAATTGVPDVLLPCEKLKIVRYGRLRSFRVIGIGISRKPVCDFLLVFHCNCLFSIVSEI